MTLEIGKIISLMQCMLKNNNLLRATALKNLQTQEDGDPYKILIGTMLSARTRDETTTSVIKLLFSKFRNPEELSRANLKEIKEMIKRIGFYNVKAARIIEVSRILVERYNSKVPSNLKDLLSFPGVGRKTANCVIVYAFRKPAIPVDVHVHRITNRIGIVSTKKPEMTEIALKKVIDRKYWTTINETFVVFGQNICLPIKPKCNLCRLKKLCKYYQNNN